jgi:hypothetical protein
MVKGRHVVKKNGVVVAEGDPAVLGLLATYFGTVYNITVKDVAGNLQTLNAVKPDSFAVGIANRNLTGVCSITDYLIGGAVVAEAVPSLTATDNGYKLTARFSPTSQITFDTVYAVARYGASNILIYKGCHNTSINVSPGESVEVEISFTVS